ncbi:MAG: MarR family transcriptional regulator [Ilumatobacteraceae bacterium]
MEEIQPSADWVAEIVARWQQLRPDLDPSPILVIGRIARLAVIIDQRLRPTFAAAGLANGDFDLLTALRRQGPPCELSPGDLATAMLVTTGATTKRIDRLERNGYVRRSTAGGDRRRRLVSLTPTGRRLVDDLFGVHLANEAAILAPLTASRRDHLAALLGELSALIESPLEGGDGPRPLSSGTTTRGTAGAPVDARR